MTGGWPPVTARERAASDPARFVATEGTFDPSPPRPGEARSALKVVRRERESFGAERLTRVGDPHHLNRAMPA